MLCIPHPPQTHSTAVVVHRNCQYNKERKLKGVYNMIKNAKMVEVDNVMIVCDGPRVVGLAWQRSSWQTAH